MKSLAQTLETLKPSFIEGLDSQLHLYMLIGSGSYESPMWIQMDQIEDDRLRFIDSQKSSIGFSIPISNEAKQLIRDYRDECYDFFKYVKYSHIREIAPSVWNELAIGFNGARISSFMESYNPPVIVEKKPTVKQLVEDGVISIIDIIEYINDYQIEKYYQEEYSDIEQYNMEYEQAERERMMQSEDMYGSLWESNDPNAPDYYDTQDVDWPTHIRSSNPEYIIASTSYRAEETYVFEATSDGKVLDSAEYGGIAKRWDDHNWEDHQDAVIVAMNNVPYRFEREIQTGSDKVRHFLYSRIGSADYWDGEQY